MYPLIKPESPNTALFQKSSPSAAKISCTPQATPPRVKHQAWREEEQHDQDNHDHFNNLFQSQQRARGNCARAPRTSRSLLFPLLFLLNSSEPKKMLRRTQEADPPPWPQAPSRALSSSSPSGVSGGGRGRTRPELDLDLLPALFPSPVDRLRLHLPLSFCSSCSFAASDREREREGED